MCSRPRSSRSSRPQLPRARSSIPTSTVSTPACPPGAISTKRSATPAVSTPATRTGMAFARCTSTPSKGSGRSCAPGSGRTGVSRRRSCRSISGSSRSCTTHAVAAKPCSVRSSPPWSHEPDPTPRKPTRAFSLRNLGATVPAELLIEHLNHIFLHCHAFLGYECLELIERLLVDPHREVFAPDPITRDLWSFLFVGLSHDGWSRDRGLNPLLFRD